MTLLEYYDDYLQAIPEATKLEAMLFALLAFLTIPFFVWWDCDFRIFRFKVKFALRKIFFRIIGGR